MPLSLVIFDVENFSLHIQIHTCYHESSARTRLCRVQERRYYLICGREEEDEEDGEVKKTFVMEIIISNTN